MSTSFKQSAIGVDAPASTGELPASRPNGTEADGAPAGDLFEQFSELRENLLFLLTTWIDRAKVYTREVIIGIFLIGLLFYSICIVLFFGMSLTFSGMAYGLGEYLDHRLWLGCVIMGLILLGGTSLSLYLGVTQFRRISFEKTKVKYEQRKATQLARYGRNADSAH